MENNSSVASKVREMVASSEAGEVEAGRHARARCAFVGGLNEESSTESDNLSPGASEFKVFPGSPRQTMVSLRRWGLGKRPRRMRRIDKFNWGLMIYSKVF
jgi:hypothetical protein